MKCLAGWALLLSFVATSAIAEEAPMLADLVAGGKLPPEAERLPEEPLVVVLDETTQRSVGQRGGSIRMLMGDQKDIRMMTVYGYARLVRYDPNLDLQPDILLSYENEGNRVFTFHLRPGHKWSDGSPFTAEDFRYQWEDYLTNPAMEFGALEPALFAEGKPPRFEVIDPLTIRYSWDAPNPLFLPALAGARPLDIYAASAYLKQFHEDYADPKALDEAIAAEGVKDWRALQIRKARSYRPENPDLPTLQPWLNTTAPPSSQYIFERNPYYHRVDQTGAQLPYLDRIYLNIAEPSIIPAKTGSGESDLQQRYLRFEDYTFLKAGEEANDYSVRLWVSGVGSAMALYPNLNTTDPVWRELVRDVRFRRALSVGIDRHQINQVLFIGLAKESAYSVLPGSPLYREELGRAYAEYDPVLANQLLDEIGLSRSEPGGVRLLPNGRPMELIVESAGESTLEADALELIRDDWAKLGIKMHTHASQRDIFRSRVAAGSTVMSVWAGVNNGAPTPSNSPEEFVPSDQYQLQWPSWGLYASSRGEQGEPIDMPEVKRLAQLYKDWKAAQDYAAKRGIWDEILDIHADQVFAIGLVTATLEPVVVSNRLRNVPEEGVSAFDPYAYFGVYEMDAFWLAEEDEKPS
jgi:peptide/nickel transport system substrate-binding protein